MKKHLLLVLAAFVCTVACGPKEAQYSRRTDKILAEIHNPNSKYVVVACHRGDWRNYPENSIPAIESIIRMGADIMELDLKLTKDSVLVLSHDATINRCLTGKGKVSDYTLAELKQMRLKRAHGVATDSLRIPTLREALECCKDRICVNVDQGYEYYDMVLKITEELGVTDQILIKGSYPARDVAEKMAQHSHNMMYMPICQLWKDSGKALFNEYMETGTVPLAYEICWHKLTPEVEDVFAKIHETGSKLWVNTIWGSLCGYLDDDKALDCGNPAQVYDKVMSFNPSFIQTDRPELLLKYLRDRGLHD